MEKYIDQGDEEEAKREEESMCVHKDSEEEEGRKKGRNFINEFTGISQMLSLYIEREESKEGGHKRSERRERQKML